MNKREFIIQYVLNRSLALAGAGLDGESASIAAARAWDRIEALAPVPKPSLPPATPLTAEERWSMKGPPRS